MPRKLKSEKELPNNSRESINKKVLSATTSHVIKKGVKHITGSSLSGAIASHTIMNVFEDTIDKNIELASEFTDSADDTPIDKVKHYAFAPFVVLGGILSDIFDKH